jgi:hypothetical protein
MPLFRNRLAALLALFAMAMQGLWPILAQAQTANALPFGEICTVEGVVKSVDLNGGSLPDGGAGKHQKHCALCVAGGDRVQVLASAPAPAVFAPAFAANIPAAQAAAHLRSTSATPAFPRAPPVRI